MLNWLHILIILFASFAIALCLNCRQCVERDIYHPGCITNDTYITNKDCTACGYGLFNIPGDLLRRGYICKIKTPTNNCSTVLAAGNLPFKIRIPDYPYEESIDYQSRTICFCYEDLCNTKEKLDEHEKEYNESLTSTKDTTEMITENPGNFTTTNDPRKETETTKNPNEGGTTKKSNGLRNYPLAHKISYFFIVYFMAFTNA